MNRRALLSSIGIGLTTAAAGCITQAGSTDDPPTETEPEPTETEQEPPTDSPSDGTAVGAGETEERTLGDDSLLDGGLRTPQFVILDNRTEEIRETNISIERSGETAFEESFELASEASVEVALTELAEYTVRASVPETDAVETVDVDLANFDCNGTTVSFEVVDDGSLTAGTISTLVACQGIVTERVAAGETESYTVGVDGGDDGSADETHAVVLENPTEEPWTVRLVLDEGSSPIFDGVYALEPDATVDVLLAESGDYHLEAAVLESDATGSEDIGPDYFDCNASSTGVELVADGDLEIASISTLIACDYDGTDE